jgi:GAF domain-containing protein
MSVDVYQPAPPFPAERERERAVQASGALLAADDPGLVAIAEEARQTFGTAMAAISIVHRDWQYLIAAVGLPSGPYSRHTSFCGHVITAPERLLFISDTHHDARFALNPSVSGGLLIRSYAGAKLLGEHGLPLGALCVFDTRPHHELAGAARGSLLSLADQVVAQLKRTAPSPAAAIATAAAGTPPAT